MTRARRVDPRTMPTISVTPGLALAVMTRCSTGVVVNIMERSSTDE